jgi:hypothetical protein
MQMQLLKLGRIQERAKATHIASVKASIIFVHRQIDHVEITTHHPWPCD